MKTFTKPIGLLSVVLISCISLSPVKSQSSDNVQDILQAGIADANTYLDGYLDPMFQSLSYGMNSGWYNTAKPHKSLGFDLTITMNFATVPKGKEMFVFKNSEFSNMRLQSGTEDEVATFIGPNEPGPTLEVYDEGSINGTDYSLVVAQFTAPGGTGITDYTAGMAAMPAPTINLGLGIVKGTDIKVRFVPDVLNDVDYSIWGVGILHDWGQWIPVINKLPIDFALFGAYTKMNFTYMLQDNIFPGSDQGIEYDQAGWTLEALVSKKIAVLTIYGGLGYNSASTETNLLGTYQVDLPAPPGAPPGYIPPSYYVQEGDIRLDTSDGSVRATIGLRFKLSVFTLHGQYAYNGYNTISTGLGIAFR